TTRTSFASTPTNYYAGPRVASLPKVAQQLILESSWFYEAHKIENGINNIVEDGAYTATLNQVRENGGDWLAFDADVEDKLAEINEGILADLEASTNFDGAAVVELAREVYEKWSEKVNELGFVDEGPISTLPEWFSGHDWDEEIWHNAVVTEILAKYSTL